MLTWLPPPPERQLLSRRSAAVHAQIRKHQKARTEPAPAAKHGARVARNQQNPTPGPGAASPRILEKQDNRTGPVQNPTDISADPPVGTLSHRRWFWSRSSSPPTQPRSQHSTLHQQSQPPPPPPRQRARRRDTGKRRERWRRGQSSEVSAGTTARTNGRVGSEAALSLPTQSELDASVLQDRKWRDIPQGETGSWSRGLKRGFKTGSNQ